MARIAPPLARGWGYRWFLGQPLNGVLRTDATFFRWGEKRLYPTPVRRYSYRPGYQRFAVRWAIFPGGLVMPWAWVAHRMILLSTLGLISATLVSWAGWRAYQGYRHREMTQKYARPLHDVLGPFLGHPQTLRAADYISVPYGFKRTKKHPVVIKLPRGFDSSEGHKESLVSAVVPKIGLEMPLVHWEMEGSDPWVSFSYRPVPPKLYPWSEARDLVMALPVGTTIVGMAAENALVKIDWTVDDPHAAIQAGTGSGKSAFLMAQIVQWLIQGSRVFAIDPKMTSLDPLMVAKGFRVANDPDDIEGMWHIISLVYSEMTRRRNLRSKDRTLTWPLWYLVIDEMTVFGAIDAAAWLKIRDKSMGPISEAFEMIIKMWLMGREFGIRVVVVGQRIDEKTMRGFFGSSSTRAISKHQVRDWVRIFGNDPYQAPSVHRGRWFWKISGAPARAVQNLYLTDQEVTDEAQATVPLGAAPVPVPIRVPFDGDDVVTGEVVKKVDRDIVGLEAAARVLETSVEALKKRRYRERKAGRSIPGESKVGGQVAFNREALVAWHQGEDAHAE